MIRMTLRSMLGRRGSMLGSLVAFTLAVTFMLAMATMMVAAFRGPTFTARFGEADLVVRVNTAEALDVPSETLTSGIEMRVPASDTERIAAVPGVASVVPVTLFPAHVLGPDGSPVVVSDEAVPTGQSWSAAALAPFHLDAGRAPATANEVTIDAGIARAGEIDVGDRVVVATAGGVRPYTVSGVASLPDGGTLERQSNVFFQEAVASDIAAADGGADVVGVTLSDDADRDEVRDRILAVDSAQALEVLSGAARGKADVAAGRDLVAEMGELLGVMAGFVGFVTIFVLASTFGFAVQQRRREIGLQRAIGYTPGQVRRAILVDALAVGAVGSIIGVIASQPLSALLTSGAIRWGKLPEGFSVAPSGLAIAIVVASALAIALLAAWIAARKTSRILPIEALRDASVPPPRIGFWRYAMGVVFLIAGAACVLVCGSVPGVIGISLSLGVVISWALACALLGPRLVQFGTRLLARLRRVPPASVDGLAFHNTRHLAFRMASVVTPIALALGMTTMMFGFAPTQVAATVAVTDQRMTADIYVLPDTSVLSREQAARVGDIPGVASVTIAVPITIGFGAGTDSFATMSVLAVDPDTLPGAMTLNQSGGDLSEFDSGTIVIDEMMEIDFPGEIGDTVPMILPDGTPRNLRWVASADNLIGAGDALIAIDDVPASYGVSLVMATVEDGSSIDEVTQSIAALRADGMPVSVVTRDQYVDGVRQSIQQQAWASNLIIGSAAAFGVLGAINTLVMSIAQRRREFALMRMIGATRTQVLRMMRTEALIAAAIGIITGVFIGVASLTPVSVGITGGATALRLSGLGLLLSAAAGGAIVLGTTFLASRSALRGVLATEIGQRE